MRGNYLFIKTKRCASPGGRHDDLHVIQEYGAAELELHSEGHLGGRGADFRNKTLGSDPTDFSSDGVTLWHMDGNDEKTIQIGAVEQIFKP